MFPTRMFPRRMFPDRGEAFALPAMPAFTGYVIVTIDGVRYALAGARLDP